MAFRRALTSVSVDGRFDAVHHLEATTGEWREHGYWASILNSADQDARRSLNKIVRKRLPSLFTVRAFSKNEKTPVPFLPDVADGPLA